MAALARGISPARIAVLGVAAAVALTGCGGIGVLTMPRDRVEPATLHLPPDAEAARHYLEALGELAEASPARQAEIAETARLAAENAPTTMNRLRHSLLLGLPGHGASDPVAARRQLSELLARPVLLLPAERALAAVFLRTSEDRLVLTAENRRLQQESATDRDRQRAAATSRRLQAEIEENQRLRRALDDAQKKLDAVSELERSITERGGTGATQGKP